MPWIKHHAKKIEFLDYSNITSLMVIPKLIYQQVPQRKQLGDADPSSVPQPNLSDTCQVRSPLRINPGWLLLFLGQSQHLAAGFYSLVGC